MIGKVGKRIVALDIGDKRIGVAVSDPFNEYAMPSETFFRTGDLARDLEGVLELVSAKSAGTIVCGMPVNFDGTESVQTEKTREFIAALKERTSLPVELEDERFTTMQAREVQIAGGVKRDKRKQTVDSIAASYILDGYLARMKTREREENEKGDQKDMNEKELIEDEEYDYEDNILELEDDEGNVERYLHVGTIDYKGEWYCFFQKAEPETEEEEDEVVMFRLVGEGENQELLPLEDEQLMDEVFAEFCNQYEQYENSDEAMSLE